MISNIFKVELYKQKKFIIPFTLGSYLVIFSLIALYWFITKYNISLFTERYIVIDFLSGIIAPLLVSYAVNQSIRQDRHAGNFVITNYVKNPFFDWGESQIIFTWLYNAIFSTIIILLLSLIFGTSFQYLLVFNICNLFIVANICYLITRIFSETITYIVSFAAILLSLIARTSLFDNTMLLVPPTWDIRMTLITMYNSSNFMIGVIIFIIFGLILTIINLIISYFKNI